jgi:hypothetical protein
MKRRLFVVSVLMVLVWATVAWGEPIAKEIYYQKKTTLAYPATHTLRFGLYDTPDVESGAPPVWEEEKPVKLTSALIKTYLGDTIPLDPSDFSEQLWVQVEKKKKDGTYVLIGKAGAERDKLLASPYDFLGGIVSGTSTSGGGVTPSAALSFLGPTVSVTVGDGQRVYVSSNKALGSTVAGGATDLGLAICYRLAGTADIISVGGWSLGLRVPQNTRVPMGLTAVISGLEAGTYDVGLCGSTSSANWNSNEYGYTSALVFSTP